VSVQRKRIDDVCVGLNVDVAQNCGKLPQADDGKVVRQLAYVMLSFFSLVK
jgi:hypothetical protein